MKYEVRPDEEVSAAVVEAVSAYEDRGLPSLPPLADVIDPDALDSLFSRTSDDVDDRPGLVSFTYSSSHVLIDPNAEITVDDPPRTEVGAMR
jgi:hypothetical protein